MAEKISFPGKELVLATRNEDKIREIKEILKNLNLRILTYRDFPSFPRVKEDGKTLEENALKKAREVARVCGKVSLADDSGLEVEALEGKPGIFSSRFAGEGCTYEDNTRKLLKLMEKISPEKRGATFRCVICISDPEGKCILLEGKCKGKITLKPRGKGGFGYDPVFLPQGQRLTFAEMSPEEKNRISHRARALKKAKEILKNILL